MLKNFFDPDWDKGRSINRQYALDAWHQHLWTGVGFDNITNYGLQGATGPPHNFIVSSLFYNGIIGTVLFVVILFLSYNISVRLWRMLKGDDSYKNDMIKLLIVVSFCWLVPFWTQEVIFEKYSLSIQFMYLGIIANLYRQKIDTVKN